jgi:hypothetical protein
MDCQRSYSNISREKPFEDVEEITLVNGHIIKICLFSLNTYKIETFENFTM